MKTWKILIIIFVISRSLKNHHNGRGERVLVLLYSELARRYNTVEKRLQGQAGRHKQNVIP